MRLTESQLASADAQPHPSMARVALQLAPVALVTAVLVFHSPWLTLGATLAIALFLLCANERRVGVVVLAVAAYAPFEEMALKAIPREHYLAARFGPYAFLGLLLIAIWARRLLEGRPLWIRTPIDLPLAAFGAVALASWAASGLPLEAALVAFQPLLRFLPLVFYLLQFANFDTPGLRVMQRLLLAVVFLEALIGLSQAVFGMPAWQFFAPSPLVLASGHEVGGTTQALYGGSYQILGTLSRYNQFAALLGLAIVFSVPMFQNAKSSRWIYWIFYSLTIPAILLAGSRAAWLGVIVACWALLVLRRRIASYVLPLLLAVVLILSFQQFVKKTEYIGSMEASITERLLEPLSLAYLDTASRRGRLYYILRFPPAQVSLGPHEALLGFGPGSLGRRSMEIFGIYTLDRVGTIRAIQHLITDVHWAFILGQVGLLGLGSFLWILSRLARLALWLRSRSGHTEVRVLAEQFLGVLIFFSVNAFFSPIWEFRSPSLYFWLIAAAMVRLSDNAAATDSRVSR